MSGEWSAHRRAERIRRIRTAEVTMSLRAADGTAVAGRVVTVRQLRHRFLFGCNIFGLKPGDASPRQQSYQAWFRELLNYATLPFYWGAYEPEPGRPDDERLEAMARWCEANGIACKGHPLCWHEVAPRWHEGRSMDEMRRLQIERIRREVKRFAGLVDRWDVVNEAVVMPTFVRSPNHMTPLVQRLGVVPVLKECFEAAREANPSATLVLNDYDHSEAYERLIEGCIEAGVPFDVIGLQSHMHRGYLGDERIWTVCERFARFGKPLHWTEATIISGDDRPDMDWHTRAADWPTTTEGEARQAAQATGFYETLFSHRAVEAVTWWDFPDGCWLGAPAGLVRADISRKPVYDALMARVKGEWWLGDQRMKTNAAGQLTFRGWLGDYTVAVGRSQAAFSLDRPGPVSVELTV